MIHTIIATERRKAPRELALPMNADIRVQTGTDANGFPIFDVTPQPPQLHSLGTKITDESNILYAAEWDGKSPWVVVHIGEIADLKMAYSGWPMEEQAEYEARIEVERLAWEAGAADREAARIAKEERIAALMAEEQPPL